MAHIDRILAPDYLPTDTDILCSSRRSSRIIDSYLVSENANLHVFDTPGVRAGQKHWVHSFENCECHCLIFVASLSGYDECFMDDKNAVSKGIYRF